MATNRIFTNDRKLLRAIRDAGDGLLLEMQDILDEGAREGLALAIPTAPEDTGDLKASGFVEPSIVDERKGVALAHFGFKHPQAASIEEGVIYGRSPKEHGKPAPRFTRKAAQKTRKTIMTKIRERFSQWLKSKGFEPK